MTIRIDEKLNVVRILLRDSPIEESDELAPGVIHDYDEQGRLVGIEFINARDTLGDLASLAQRPTAGKLVSNRTNSKYGRRKVGRESPH